MKISNYFLRKNAALAYFKTTKTQAKLHLQSPLNFD
jgi:hypothetical protein